MKDLVFRNAPRKIETKFDSKVAVELLHQSGSKDLEITKIKLHLNNCESSSN